MRAILIPGDAPSPRMTIPKSLRTTRPVSGSRKMLPGLMSPWLIPWLYAASTASATCLKIMTAWATGMGCWTHCLSVGHDTYSMATQCIPSSVSLAYTGRMLGWSSAATRSISVAKRSMRALSVHR